jgi:hypothetical protein
LDNSQYEQQLAAREAQRTGLDPNVELAQWTLENGSGIPASNNFGNITYYGGVDQVGYFKGNNGQKFARYATPLAGADAYGNLINQSYGNVAKAGGPAAQISALQASPWDAGHYTGLPATYNAVVSKTGGGATIPTDTTATGVTGWLQGINWSKIGTNAVAGIIGVIIILAILMRK